MKDIENRIEKLLLKLDTIQGYLKNITTELESIQDEIKGD